ncbi:hypothetical protein BDN72DRAFT_747482, partial [Pluteus cervinus]
PMDAIRFGMTCHWHHDLATTTIKAEVDANKIFTQFFDPEEALEFREFLRKSGGIISGRAALQLLEGKIGVTTNLDLYVGNEHRWSLRDWLRERCYWGVLSQQQVQASPYGHGFSVVKVIRFERHFEGLTRTIHCMVTEDSPVEAILELKLTCAMNFFTHESAYSLFPIATFDNRKGFL